MASIATADGARRVRDDFETTWRPRCPARRARSVHHRTVRPGARPTPAPGVVVVVPPADRTDPDRRPRWPNWTGSPRRRRGPTGGRVQAELAWRTGAVDRAPRTMSTSAARRPDDLLDHRRRVAGPARRLPGQGRPAGSRSRTRALEQLRRQAARPALRRADRPRRGRRARPALPGGPRHGARPAVGAGDDLRSASGCSGTIATATATTAAWRPSAASTNGTEVLGARRRRPGAVRAGQPAHGRARRGPDRRRTTARRRRRRLGRGAGRHPARAGSRPRRPPSWPTRTSPSTGASAASATSRSGAAGTAGPGDRGLLPQLRQPVLVRRQAAAGRPRRRPVRGRRAASPTAAWAGSTSPGTARSPTAGSCSRACSTRDDEDAMAAAARRAPLPGRGRAPEHRQDPQLRRARRRRLHRHGVRRRHQPARAARGAARPPTAAGPTRSRSTRPSPTASRSSRRSGTSTTSASLYCDFKPDNVIHTAELGRSSSTSAACTAWTTATSPVYGTVGLPGTRDRPDRPDRALRPLHGRPHAGRAVHRLPVATRARTGTRCRPAQRRRRSSLDTTRSTASSSGRPPPIPTPGSRAPTRWPPSSWACCARSSPTSTRDAVPRRQHRFTARGRRAASTPPTGAALPAPLVDPDDPAAAVILSLGGAGAGGDRRARSAAAADRASRPTCGWPVR